jgi:hypothetical protein
MDGERYDSLGEGSFSQRVYTFVKQFGGKSQERFDIVVDLVVLFSPGKTRVRNRSAINLSQKGTHVVHDLHVVLLTKSPPKIEAFRR